MNALYLAPASSSRRQLAISVRQLAKTFGEGDIAAHAVNGIDLDVAVGEIVLIMGPSGSGKTTLLLMLGAMLRPTNGSIVIDGLEIATAPEKTARAKSEPPRIHISRLQSSLGAQRARGRRASVQCRWNNRHRRPRTISLAVTTRWAGKSAQLPTGPTLRWRKTAGSDCSRARQQPDSAPRRRTYCQPRLATWPRNRCAPAATS